MVQQLIYLALSPPHGSIAQPLCNQLVIGLGFHKWNSSITLFKTVTLFFTQFTLYAKLFQKYRLNV